jgi:hypothetical protein
MYIHVENLLELCEKHPELEIVRDITANHGEKSEISLLCELIAKLYEKIDSLSSTKPTSVKTK